LLTTWIKWLRLDLALELAKAGAFLCKPGWANPPKGIIIEMLNPKEGPFIYIDFVPLTRL